MTLSRMCRYGFFAALVLVIASSLAPGAWFDPYVRGHDKLVHLAGYFILAMLAAMGWPRWRGAALIGLPLTGLALEVAQTSTGRGFEWMDVLSNAAGIGIAVALSAALTRRLSPE